MNKIVRKIVPVSELPAELQDQFDLAAEVEIVGPAASDASPDESLVEMFDEYRRGRQSPFRSSRDVVDYVRAVRDGGDLEPWLGACSTSTPTS
jgi:hypothetical protein